MDLNVNEIFYSIQGESLYAGLPCVFVRLTGCNLRCSYCDTRYAYDEGVFTSIAEIMTKIRSYQCPLVQITGGEPLLQEKTQTLIAETIRSGLTVLLETNGTKDISLVDPGCIKIVDIKCPGSGEKDKNDMNNFNRLSSKDQIKFVITDRMDYDFAKNLINSVWSFKPPVAILFSPAYNILDPAELADWMLKDRLNVRLQMQLHKILWPNVDRGK